MHHTQRNGPDTIRYWEPWWFPSRATHVPGVVGVARPLLSDRHGTANGVRPTRQPPLSDHRAVPAQQAPQGASGACRLHIATPCALIPVLWTSG